MIQSSHVNCSVRNDRGQVLKAVGNLFEAVDITFSSVYVTRWYISCRLSLYITQCHLERK